MSRRTLLRYVLTAHNVTRRLCTACLGLCVWPRLAATPLSSLDDPVSGISKGFSRTTVVQRRYRVDATVLLCGLPWLTRKNVGGGYASVEIGSAPGARAIALQFAAGSWPARTRGLNRFGILREVVVQGNEEPPGFAFAGLITHSPEQNLGEARKTFLRAAAAPLDAIFSVGEMRAGVLVTSTSVIQLPAPDEWAHAVEKLHNLRDSGRPVPTRDVPASLAPFLYVMHCAGLNKDSRYQRRFIHCGRPYSLEAHRKPSHPSELFAEIHDEAGAKCAEFRASYSAQDDGGLPCRIEYHPKPFLRLVFELDPAATQPAIPSVFSQEST